MTWKTNIAERLVAFLRYLDSISDFEFVSSLIKYTYNLQHFYCDNILKYDKQNVWAKLWNFGILQSYRSIQNFRNINFSGHSDKKCKMAAKFPKRASK